MTSFQTPEKVMCSIKTLFGIPLATEKIGLQGVSVVMHGTPLVSAESATEFVLSGVLAAIRRLTFSPRIDSEATSAARFELD